TRDKVSIILQNHLMESHALELEEQLEKVILEKQEQETMLIQQSKLAETGEMISMIAHQWRQPLSTISSVVATFKAKIELDIYGEGPDFKEKIVDDLYEAFAKIEQSASFLSNTINDFRNFYRPDNAPREFNILKAIDTILDMTVAPNSSFVLKREYNSEDDHSVTTFEGELQQVVINIVNNAKDIFEEKGILNGRIVLKVEKDLQHFIITITDNGGGIPADVMDNIFLPYFSTKDKKNGTGIGLHMTKTIVENHMNGTIKVDNDMIMGGARFKIEIPIKLREALNV
ncbi:MAG: HAMP domain-containing histidine kinase, partial [Thiovulaceae bacterium]|nr:HAMP domain-containing histidine kinase [Sulfurimonadaceae bacterium]